MAYTFEDAKREVKEEAGKSLDDFRKSVEAAKTKVQTFDKSNFDELLKMIFNNSNDLTDLEGYADILKKRINDDSELKERLLYQKKLTTKEIIEENIIKIYLAYNILLATSWITSSDIIAFIKSFFTCMVIGASTFLINLRYFTSDVYKEQIDNKVVEIDNMTKINQYEISVFDKFKEMYIDELKCEVKKLYEIAKNKEYCYEAVDKMLEDIKMDFLVDNYIIKRRIKKK